MEAIIMAKKYSEMTVKELREIAKELDIKGRWDMTKTELINAIMQAESVESEEPQENENVGGIKRIESAEVENVIDDKAEVVESETKEKETDNNKSKYLEAIQIGTIVAYKCGEGKAKSAKVVKKSIKNRKLQVETSYGAVNVISFDDVLWVKTGKRWPKGIYNMFKGNKV